MNEMKWNEIRLVCVSEWVNEWMKNRREKKSEWWSEYQRIKEYWQQMNIPSIFDIKK